LHTGFLFEDGSLQFIGSNIEVQFNIPKITKKIKSISCGVTHTGLLLEDGSAIL